jgi:hypothetical protein
MFEPTLNFRCCVGTFEIRRLNEILDRVTPELIVPELAPNIPYLVRTGPEQLDEYWKTHWEKKLIAPGTRVLDQAIRTLLTVRLPEDRFYTDPKTADELFSSMGKHVLAISRRIGMLHWGSEPTEGIGVDTESFFDWARLADNIQDMFSQSSDFLYGVGHLEVLLSSKSGNATIQIQPDTTRDALMYRAAQMIAGGTTQQSCANCGERILVGGAGRDSKNKKRSDARFCSDKCRSNYHNEARRKMARKAKL